MAHASLPGASNLAAFRGRAVGRFDPKAPPPAGKAGAKAPPKAAPKKVAPSPATHAILIFLKAVGCIRHVW